LDQALSTFQNTHEHTEQQHILELLAEVERNPTLTQRGLASELGVALGLMNQYLKHCISRGWIRVSRVSSKRISYFVTPEGFSEKSRMVSRYLARSFAFFRDARFECEQMLETCRRLGWTSIAVLGPGELADIFMLVAHNSGIRATVVSRLNSPHDYDAVILTSLNHPQRAYDLIKNSMPAERILVPELLHVSRTEQSPHEHEVTA
jgi:DNA-binding MarR family transcriptional regulator